MRPRFFPSVAAFRAWLEIHHADTRELWIGFYKKAAGRAGLTYAEAVDAALCFGWIDGIIRRIDAISYTHRFTPRQPGSIWSKINVGHVARLKRAGQMHAAGLAAFAARDAKKTGVYSFEAKRRWRLPAACAQQFRAHREAWAFFRRQAPSYQRLVIFKIATAKRPETRLRWLERVIAASAAGKRL